MFRKTIQTSVLNLLSFVFQFLLNLFITTQYGIGLQLDLYNKSIAIPNYLIVLLTSCVTYIFIPLYTKINKRDKHDTPTIINEYFIIVGFFSFLFMFFADIFSDSILNLFNKKNDISNIIILQKIFLIYSPIIILSTLVEFLNTIFYSNNRFKFPLFLKILNPILVIIFISILEKKSINIAISFLISFLIQLTILLIYSNKKYFNFKLSININDIIKKNKSLVKLAVPLIFSIILTKTLPVFDVYFLSSFNDGIVSNVLLSQKLIITLSFLLNSFFSVLFFSQISHFVVEKLYDRFYEMLLMGIKSILFVSIPIIFYLLHNSDKIFKMIFEHGKFTNNDTITLSTSFKYFLIGLPVIAIGSLIAYAIYAIQNLRIFYISSIIEIFIYIGISFTFKNLFEHNAIPIAYIINFAISDLILFEFLKKQLKNNIKNKNSSYEFYKLIIVSIIFIPYYFYSNSNTLIYDSIFFLITFFIYILLLFGVKFSPIIYLFNKIRKIEK